MLHREPHAAHRAAPARLHRHRRAHRRSEGRASRRHADRRLHDRRRAPRDLQGLPRCNAARHRLQHICSAQGGAFRLDAHGSAPRRLQRARAAPASCLQSPHPTARRRREAQRRRPPTPQHLAHPVASRHRLHASGGDAHSRHAPPRRVPPRRALHRGCRRPCRAQCACGGATARPRLQPCRRLVAPDVRDTHTRVAQHEPALQRARGAAAARRAAHLAKEDRDGGGGDRALGHAAHGHAPAQRFEELRRQACRGAAAQAGLRLTVGAEQRAQRRARPAEDRRPVHGRRGLLGQAATPGGTAHPQQERALAPRRLDELLDGQHARRVGAGRRGEREVRQRLGRALLRAHLAAQPRALGAHLGLGREGGQQQGLGRGPQRGAARVVLKAPDGLGVEQRGGGRARRTERREEARGIVRRLPRALDGCAQPPREARRHGGVRELEAADEQRAVDEQRRGEQRRALERRRGQGRGERGRLFVGELCAQPAQVDGEVALLGDELGEEAHHRHRRGVRTARREQRRRGRGEQRLERRGVEERDQRDDSLEARAPRLVRLQRALWTAAAAADADDGGGERGQPGTRGPAEHGGERGAEPRGVEAAEQAAQFVLQPEVV